MNQKEELWFKVEKCGLKCNESKNQALKTVAFWISKFSYNSWARHVIVSAYLSFKMTPDSGRFEQRISESRDKAYGLGIKAVIYLPWSIQSGFLY